MKELHVMQVACMLAYAAMLHVETKTGSEGGAGGTRLSPQFYRLVYSYGLYIASCQSVKCGAWALHGSTIDNSYIAIY